MPLISCTEQDLSEFYQKLSKNKGLYVAAQAMLKFIAKLNESFPETPIYGATSLYHLNLKPQKSISCETVLTVSFVDGQYLLSYTDSGKLKKLYNPDLETIIASVSSVMLQSDMWAELK